MQGRLLYIFLYWTETNFIVYIKKKNQLKIILEIKFVGILRN